MHVRTSYLPEVGESLVCRLEHDDREVLVEGRVAWRSEGQDSGEFGIQFTALDADSADVLQSLGEPVSEPERSPFAPDVDDEDEPGGAEIFMQGSRVKLHIDGLGAPMKACVHEGSQRKLRVGSCLEFLKVGRTLQVEDLAAGHQRGAHVDSVNVVVNPATSVPELVVQLRYEGVTPTPAPAKAKGSLGMDYDDEAFHSVASGAGSRDADSEDEHSDLSDDDAAPWEPAAEALRARLGGAARSAGSIAQKAGGALSMLAKNARESVASVTSRHTVPRTSGAVARTRPQTPQTKRKQTSRRTSRAAPSHLRSGIHDLGLAGRSRPTVGRASKKVAEPPPKRRIAPAAIFALAFAVFAGSAFALRGMGDDSTPVATEAKPQGEAKQEKKPAPTKTAIAAKPSVRQDAEESEDGVVAEVPLFGPQAMAVKPAEEPTVEVDLAESERRAAAAAVEDETWDATPAEAETQDSKPWGRGRLYLPTIHRIRLDGVGANLAGAVNPDGFTIVVPGRKAMESGKAIEKRDKRIIAVETSNEARGATVKFEFRGSVPPYRVRLRKDFVEFLISAPEETVARL